MAGSAEHFKALVRSHAAGDDAAFYSVAMQVAAQEARKGHHKIAADLKSAVESSRTSGPKVTSIAQPRGDLADLVIATHPEVALKELVLPAKLATAQEPHEPWRRASAPTAPRRPPGNGQDDDRGSAGP